MTAKDILVKMFENGEPFYNEKDIIKAMEEYARIKCEEQKNICAESAKMCSHDYSENNLQFRIQVDKQSILNSKNAVDE